MTIQNKRTRSVCAGFAVCSALFAMAAHAQGVSFEAARNFAAGVNPYSVAVGDFNGDGLKDLAVANNSSNDVSVLLGNGDGNFQGPRNFTAGNTNPSSAEVESK